MIRYLSILILLFLTACSAMVIAPQPQPGSQVDLDGQRVSRLAKGVRFSAQLHEASVRPSPVNQNYSSFKVEIENQRNVLLPLAYTDFLLVDDQGRQYLPVDPAELVELLTDSAPYLVPYPYVGFYYLEDSARAQLDTQYRSERSYFASRRPEYLATEALPDADVLPASVVAGIIYFPAELRTMSGFEIRYQLGMLPGQESFQLSLPFTVEKK